MSAQLQALGEDALKHLTQLQTQFNLFAPKHYGLFSAIMVAEKHPVESPEDFAAASEVLRDVKTVQTLLEDQRKALTQPLVTQQKTINDLFRPVSTRFDAASSKIKSNMAAFQNTQYRKQQEALQAAQHAAAQASVSGPPPAALPAVQQALQTAAAAAPARAEGVTTRYVTRYAIQDPRLVPPRFWVIDERAVAAAVQAGETIPGVNVWQEPAISVRGR